MHFVHDSFTYTFEPDKSLDAPGPGVPLKKQEKIQKQWKSEEKLSLDALKRKIQREIHRLRVSRYRVEKVLQKYDESLHENFIQKGDQRIPLAEYWTRQLSPKEKTS
jgi:hypothetical protein